MMMIIIIIIIIALIIIIRRRIMIASLQGNGNETSKYFVLGPIQAL